MFSVWQQGLVQSTIVLRLQALAAAQCAHVRCPGWMTCCTPSPRLVMPDCGSGLLQVYHILMQHTSAVQPVSVDEAYLDVSGLGDPVGIAEAIRAAIQQKTGCTASAGIASNMLLARLATKCAKPDGIFHLLPAQVIQSHPWSRLLQSRCAWHVRAITIWQNQNHAQFALICECL